jgi:hypothetical protein
MVDLGVTVVRRNKVSKWFSVIALLLFVILVGISSFLDFLISITQYIGLVVYSALRFFWSLPMSFFDILTSSIKENWYLTGITIVDGFLVNFALIMPSIIFFILSRKGFKFPYWLSTLTSLLLFVFVLYLYHSITFWIFLCIVFLLSIIYWFSTYTKF